MLLLHGDCLDLMPQLADASVDLVLADMPYGTTSCAWDSLIPLEPFWNQVKRILKPNRAVVLTGSQPFTTTLINSNLPWFKYEWIWVKNRPTNFAHAKNKPMKKHENIIVFSSGTTVHENQSSTRMPYFPQGLADIAPVKVTKGAKEKTNTFFADRPGHKEFVRNKTGYPHTLLPFNTEMQGLHPTQKPVDLMRYLIRTYSNSGDLVLDMTMGSGTTGVAASIEGREFVGMELDATHFATATRRLQQQIVERKTA